jgi:hypothetical protein
MAYAGDGDEPGTSAALAVWRQRGGWKGSGEKSVKVLLRLCALVSFVWAIVLVAMQRGGIVPDAELTSLTRALANGLALTNVVLAYAFWYASSDPAANRGTIYSAMLLAALKIVNDLYEVLVLLSAEQAFASVLDLVVSIALLVGLLEALPRMVAEAREPQAK